MKCSLTLAASLHLIVLLATVGVGQQLPAELPVRIPAESKQFHQDISLTPKAGLDCTVRYSSLGELRLATNQLTLATRTLTNDLQFPFEGVFFKVVSLHENEIQLDLVPSEAIPAERRPLAGCHVLFEKSRCGIGQDEFALLKIESVKNERSGVEELRCEIVRGGRILEKKFGVGEYLDLLSEHLLIKRILPAEKNFPAWVEVEHKNKAPDSK